jgi:hypothetical protein
MFCPECKAEYRAGFTRCSDCGVDLVEQLDARASAGASASAADPNVAEVLWTGVDARVRGEVVRALEAANIPYHERLREVGMLPGMTQNVYGILVQARDRDAARKALQAPGLGEAIPIGDDADADADTALAPPADDSETDADEEGDDSDYDPENFHSDDATAEVWSGADAGVRDEMVICLEEVGIGCAVVEATGLFHIRVMPSSAPRAKEIIQQIIDAGQ